jgi:uncharacterized protein YggU (UPF0235/DUF167 family)
MVPKSSSFHDGRSGSALAVRVIPKSDVNKILEILEDGTLKIQLRTSLDSGEINSVLMKYLENVLDVPQDKIEIIAGEMGTEKLIAILDVDPNDLQLRLMNCAEFLSADRDE